jgi:hypothetical protein
MSTRQNRQQPDLIATKRSEQPIPNKDSEIEKALIIRRKLQEARPDKPEATVFTIGLRQAFVVDWVRNRFYLVELEVFTDPMSNIEDPHVNRFFFSEFRAWRAKWAHKGAEFLNDPEMAAGLRGLVAVAEQWYGLRRGQYRVTGTRLT